MLDGMFGKADIKTDSEEQIQVLLDVDGDGQLEEDDEGVHFTFIKCDGSRYDQGHGRYKCDVINKKMDKIRYLKTTCQLLG